MMPCEGPTITDQFDQIKLILGGEPLNLKSASIDSFYVKCKILNLAKNNASRCCFLTFS